MLPILRRHHAAPPCAEQTQTTGLRALLGAHFAHACARGLMVFLVPWVVLASGASVPAAMAAGALLTLPYLLLGIPAGLIGDRVQPRTMLAGSLGLAALALCVYPVALLTGSAPLWLLLAAGFCLGCAQPFEEAAAYRAIGSVGAEAQVLRVNGRATTLYTGGFYGGPAAGLVAYQLVGAPGVAALAALLCAAGACSALRARLATEATREADPLAALRSGARSLVRRPGLRLAVSGGVAWCFVAAAGMSMVSPLFREQAALDTRQASLVFLVGGIAVALATPLLLRVGRRRFGPFDMSLRALGLEAILLAGLGAVHGIGSAALLFPALLIIHSTAAAGLSGARMLRVERDQQALVNVVAASLMTVGWIGGQLVSCLLAAACGLPLALLVVGAATALATAGLHWRGTALPATA
jgi:hypothetical protein